jgi:hypothetical protein
MSETKGPFIPTWHGRSSSLVVLLPVNLYTCSHGSHLVTCTMYLPYRTTRVHVRTLTWINVTFSTKRHSPSSIWWTQDRQAYGGLRIVVACEVNSRILYSNFILACLPNRHFTCQCCQSQFIARGHLISTNSFL